MFEINSANTLRSLYFASMHAKICREQLLVGFVAHDEKALPILNVLPLYYLLNHLCIEHHFYCASVYNILTLTPTQHVTDKVCVLYSLLSCLIEI